MIYGYAVSPRRQNLTRQSQQRERKRTTATSSPSRALAKAADRTLFCIIAKFGALDLGRHEAFVDDGESRCCRS
jgi:hypothetical protein